VIDGVVRDRQVKVLFVDGEREGLRSWVRTEQLLCLWSKREPQPGSAPVCEPSAVQ
jgi:hypothetical protein